MDTKKLLVILGPTATGKTDIAINLAKKFSGAIVSCDSRQVYTGLDIGSGKYPNTYQKIEKKLGLWIVDGIKIYLYDVVDPSTKYSVAQFVKDVNAALEEIRRDQKLPIIVGGTGLYLKALLEGLSNIESPINQVLRKSLEKLSKQELQEKLQKVDWNKWEAMNNSDRQNPRRLIRYIEIALNGKKVTISKTNINFNNVLKLGLSAPWEFLYEKVDQRVINRLNNGMVEEVKKLVGEGLTYERLKQLGLEYGLLADFLQGKISQLNGQQGLIKIMQNKIHGYVRRQLTWFKREKNVIWIDVSQKDAFKQIEKIVLEWYDKQI